MVLSGIYFSHFFFFLNFTSYIRNYNLDPQLNLLFKGSWRTKVDMEVTNSISTLTFNQVETCQKLQIPESIHASVHDVKLGLFQYLFGEDDIIPGDNSNAWSEFANFVNLHPTFKIKLSRKLEGENLDKVDWKMSDCATGIKFIPEYKTLLTPRYNTMTSLCHEGLMKDLETWVCDGTGITSQPTTIRSRRASETEFMDIFDGIVRYIQGVSKKG